MSADFQPRFARGLAYQGLSQLAQSAITLVLIPLVIKLSGPAPYGAYVVLNSIILLVTTFCSLGAGFKCRRTLPGAPDDSAKAGIFLPNASFQLLTATASFVLLAAGLPLLNRFAFHGEIEVRTTTIFFVVLAFYANNLADDYFRYTHRIPLLSKAIIVRAVLHPGLVLAAAAGHLPLQGDSLLLLQAIAYLVVAAWLWWCIHREITLTFRLNTWPVYLDDLRLGFPLIIAVLVENLLATTDRYVLAAFISPAGVGAYAAAFTLGNLVLLLPRIANSALLPTLSQLTDTGRQDEAQQLLRNFLQVFLMLALPFIVGCALLGRSVLAWLTDAEVSGLAYRVVPLVAVAGTLYGYGYLMFNALFVNQCTKQWLKANVWAAAVSITLNLLLVGWLRRIEAAAVVAVVSYGVGFLIIRRAAGGWQLHLDRLLLAKSAIATLGMALVLSAGCTLPYGHGHDAARLLVLVVVGVVTYFGLLAWPGGYTPNRFRRTLGI